MSGFKMVHVDLGGEVQVSFICEHCTASHGIGLKENTGYGRPYRGNRGIPRQAGECSRCQGTGFDPEPYTQGEVCRECHGTGVCAHCQGRFVRSWTELPIETQDRFIENWERDGRYPRNYANSSRYSNH